MVARTSVTGVIFAVPNSSMGSTNLSKLWALSASRTAYQHRPSACLRPRNPCLYPFLTTHPYLEPYQSSRTSAVPVWSRAVLSSLASRAERGDTNPRYRLRGTTVFDNRAQPDDSRRPSCRSCPRSQLGRRKPLTVSRALLGSTTRNVKQGLPVLIDALLQSFVPEHLLPRVPGVAAGAVDLRADSDIDSHPCHHLGCECALGAY
jgi:hypothetical protein